jgi:hypothetical protein
MGVQAEPAPAQSAQPAASGQTGANAQTAGTDPTPSSSPAAEEQVARGPDLIRQAFTALRSRTTQTYVPAPQAPPASRTEGTEPERTGTPAPKQKATPGTTLPARSPAAAPANQQPGQGGIVLTQAELDRRIQAETDRRLEKQRSDQRAREEREQEQRLRREDPFEYVRLLEAREAEQAEDQKKQQEAIGLLEQQLNHYDRGILDPIVGALPEPTRKKILSNVKAEGIPGRQEVARQSLTALRMLWNAEGREAAKETLMKDPTFVKEILARYGGQRDDGPPEVVAGLPPSSASRTVSPNEAVNGWMRSAGSAARSTSGRR